MVQEDGSGRTLPPQGPGVYANNASFEAMGRVQRFQEAADAVSEEGAGAVQSIIREAIRTKTEAALHVVQAAVENIGEGVRAAYASHFPHVQPVYEVPMAQAEHLDMHVGTEHRAPDANGVA